MTIRSFFYLFVLIFGAICSLEAAEPSIKLSSIAPQWNEDAQKLDFFFQIENHTQQSVDLAGVIVIQTTRERITRSMTFENIGPKTKELFTLSYETGRVRQGDKINISINLYGKEFKKFLDRADKQIEVTTLIFSGDGQMKIALTELWPLFEYSPRAPTDFVQKLAWKLVNDVDDKRDEEKKGSKVLPETSPIKIVREIKEDLIEPKYLIIMARQPDQRADKVKPDVQISATFDELIGIDMITDAIFYLKITSGKQKGKKLSGSINTVNGEVVFIPEKPLAFNTEFEVVITDQLKSLGGNKLEQSEFWKFRTLKPSVKKAFGAKKDYLQLGSIYPPVKGKNILVDSKIEISFRSEVNPDTVTSGSFYLASGKEKIAGALKVRKNKIVLTPEKPLAFAADYRVIATKEIKDVTGKGLKGTVRWRFKTRPKIDYPEADDPNILIFSPSHEQISYVLEKDGILKIGITAFDPILHVDVNGSMIKVDKGSKIDFGIPYRLKSKLTPFKIMAFTQAGKSHKKFRVNFGKKPKPKRPMLQVVGILGLANLDNIDNAPSSSTHSGASKVVITVVPQFNYQIFEDSYIRVRGIILREMYSAETYINQSDTEKKSADKATSYTQLAVEWEELDTLLGNLTGGIGWNFVRTNTSSFLGENDVLNETFFGGSLKQKISDTMNYNVGLEYKNKNSTVEASDADNETDGVATTLKGKFNFDFLGINNSAKLAYVGNDAVGKYQDFASTKVDYSISYTFGDFTPSFGYSLKSKQMTIENPAKENVTPFYHATQLTLKVNYKLFAKSILSFDYKARNQASNLDDSTYKINTATLSFTQIF